MDFQALVFKLDYLRRLLVALNIDDSIVELVGQAYTMLLDLDRLNQEDVGAAPRASIVKNGRRGRPSFDVKEELTYLLEQGFKVSDISKVVGVSQRTIYIYIYIYIYIIFKSPLNIKQKQDLIIKYILY